MHYNNILFYPTYIPDEFVSSWEIENTFRYEAKINYEELSKNDFELHKKLMKEGVNPSEISKIIRNDDIEKLQEISSQANFDFNQTIKPSLYERCSFINERNVKLIDYAAFFSSVKCFKYLLVNGANIKYTGKYAVASGNEEIIHLCEQNHSSFEGAYKAAIEFHRNDIFKYIYENKLEKIENLKYQLKNLWIECVLYNNYEIFKFLLEENEMTFNETYNIIANEIAADGNLYLIQYILKDNNIPINILLFAIESGNIELSKYILINQKGFYINAIDFFGF